MRTKSFAVPIAKCGYTRAMRRKGRQVPSMLRNISKLPLVGQCDHKAIHDNHNAQKCGGAAEWTPRAGPAKIYA
jgi:hypothetical protein